MPKVVLKENEVLDDALKRFKRQVSRNGTLAEARKREFYVVRLAAGNNQGDGKVCRDADLFFIVFRCGAYTRVRCCM